MGTPADTIRKRLNALDFRALFVEDLGWDHKGQVLNVLVDGVQVSLELFAHKRGFGVLKCPPVDGAIPDHEMRRKIDRETTKAIREHLIVFVDAAQREQVWQWTRREPGLPVRSRETHFSVGKHGDLLIQRLQELTFRLDEEETLTIVDASSRVRAAFDVERVTKRFYDRFKTEHASFLKSISGIDDSGDREWYASLMLNRLMFVYFIQRKGFLDGDANYLRNRLERCRKEHGKDRFYSFYRCFLLRLFHEGLGSRERNAELDALLGRIPYLNGGLFDIHELEKSERYGKGIDIPDRAFERVFDYFDEYQWYLDERPLRADNEINPDVLGYVFEKYVNQKQMGAYYTKEDITEYISKYTVLPCLLDTARARCKVAFENPGGPTVWDTLSADPDRYIYKPVRHGVTWNYQARHLDQGEPLGRPYDLPEDIVAGLAPPSLHRQVGDVGSINDVKTIRLRKDWNKPAPPDLALPTETWREVVARRKRHEEVKAGLAGGNVRDISGLITLNLDICQFAQDVIENCEGPDLLRAFWHAIERVTILDPTCGSGAFLFAALNLLEPLYEASLERMEAFIDDLERSGEKHRPEKYSDFRKVLERVAAHPNRRYFILKSIILNNLYGVDIMEEAVEICKLRLFLKLAAQVEPDAARSNLGVEPLPDIDFNIRAGNTLVGFATYEDVQRSLSSRFDFENAGGRIRTTAADLQQAFDAFRERQVEGDVSVPTEDKQELRKRLEALDSELSRYLAGEYGVDPSKKDAYDRWRSSHQPFHWFVQFYGIMNGGGFDVIVGNPPYVEYKAVKKEYAVRGYETEACRNLYAFTWERVVALGRRGARAGLIIPVSSISTDRYAPLREVWLSNGNLIVSSFNDRPGRLFEGLEHARLAIVLLEKAADTSRVVYTTGYNKWFTECRGHLFRSLQFAKYPSSLAGDVMAKVGSMLEASTLGKVTSSRRVLGHYATRVGRERILYTRKLSSFVQILDFVPRITDAQGRTRAPSELKSVGLPSRRHRDAFLCALNSSVFYWLLSAWSDCRNLNKRDVLNIPLDFDALNGRTLALFARLASDLMQDLKRNSRTLEMSYTDLGVLKIQCIYPRLSKPIIDEIDALLAQHYGFTEEELDFIVNYDIKYRMGPETESEDE